MPRESRATQPQPTEDLAARLKGCGVVYFGNDWFATNRTSSHHIAARLAQYLPVLYVDSPGLRAPSASGHDFKRALRKVVAAFRAPELIDANLWHYTVPQLPFRRVAGVDAFNRAFSSWAVRRGLRCVGMSKPISWFVVPHPGFLSGRLGECLSVYYCIDDYAAHPGVDAELIAARDDGLSRAVDLLFVAPPALLESKRRMNSTATYAPHGVDVALFSKANDPDTAIPHEVADLTLPIIGYFGSVHEWIDLELLEWLATERPNWTFLFVGHAAVDVSRLRALPNVRFAGAQPYESLPSWAKTFDVAIIPYRLNRQVLNANPLKLREYLATGKPIVSVSNPEIQKFSEWVRIAGGREDFLAQIEAALASEDPGAAAARMAVVADQTWDRRVVDVLSLVAETLDERRGRSAAGHP